MHGQADTLATALPRVSNETSHYRTRCWADAKNGGVCSNMGDWEKFNGLCPDCFEEIVHG